MSIFTRLGIWIKATGLKYKPVAYGENGRRVKTTLKTAYLFLCFKLLGIGKKVGKSTRFTLDLGHFFALGALSFI